MDEPDKKPYIGGKKIQIHPVWGINRLQISIQGRVRDFKVKHQKEKRKEKNEDIFNFDMVNASLCLKDPGLNLY